MRSEHLFATIGVCGYPRRAEFGSSSKGPSACRFQPFRPEHATSTSSSVAGGSRIRVSRNASSGSDEWAEFTGTCVAQKILGGLGNIDDNVIELPAGTYRAVTIRAFDLETENWSIWWLDGRHPKPPLDPPVIGRFEDGIGEFYADDTIDGQPIRARFLWNQTGPTWEQAFSTDGGATWETNWTMRFTRTAA